MIFGFFAKLIRYKVYYNFMGMYKLNITLIYK